MSAEEEKRYIHKQCVDKLVEKFRKEGFKIIREGKMPTKGWREPDLFVLKNLKLLKVVEVIVLDPYEDGENSVKEKARKIKEYYNPPEIIIFEPTDYLDRVRLPKTKSRYKKETGHEFNSYTQIQEYYAKKWRKEEGLDIIFWNDKNILCGVSKSF